MPVIDDEFYRDCWSHWSDTCNLDFVVQNKMPIPYFGDVGAYMQSEPRVITVALNPNLDVFPCTRCNGVLEPKETERRLSVYFREREIAGDLPRWFSSYKHVLEGAGYSYLDCHRSDLGGANPETAEYLARTRTADFLGALRAAAA